MRIFNREISWPVVSVAAVLVLAVLLGGAGFLGTQRDVGDVGQEVQEFVPGIGGGPEQERSISDIAQNPDQYVNQRVTLRGEVDRIIDDRAFVIDQEGVVFRDELLVVFRSSIPLQNADHVTVSGIVTRLTVELEQELGLFLEEEIQTEFRDKPVLLADEIMLSSPE